MPNMERAGKVMGKCQCGRKWKGRAEAHCTGCHNHFRSVGGFDKHRTGAKEGRRCMDYDEMIAVGMAYNAETDTWVGASMPEGCVFNSTNPSKIA